jgi:phosphate uptake regulator
MQTPITWEVALALLTLVAAGVGVTWKIFSAIGEVRDEVAKHKLEVARDYASIATVARIEERFTATADKLIARIDVLAEAFNRMAGQLDHRQE